MNGYDGRILAPKKRRDVDLRTTEQGEECKACGFITTNSQPDCRCS